MTSGYSNLSLVGEEESPLQLEASTLGFLPVSVEDEEVEDAYAGPVGHQYGGMYGRVPPGAPKGSGNLHILEAAKSVGETLVQTVKNETTAVFETVAGVQQALGTASEAVSSFFKELVQVVEHPVNSLLKTRIGTGVLIFLVIAVLIVLIRVTGPSVRMAYDFVCIISRGIAKVVIFFCAPIYHLIKSSACCMRFCATAPLIKVRNWHIARKIDRADRERIKVYRADEMEEMIQVLKRTHSALKTDEYGVYLDAGENHRVYLDPNTQTEDLITLRMLPTLNRERGAAGIIKESCRPCTA